MARSGDVAALVWVLFAYRGVDQAKPGEANDRALKKQKK